MITWQMQIQAVARALDGIETNLPVEQFEDPWARAYRIAIKKEDQQNRIQILSRILDRDALGDVLAEVQEPWRYPTLQEIAQGLQPIEWLWRGWLPRGMISLLGAVPGAGKSYLALDLTRRIISGESFPDGAGAPSFSDRVLYVDAEVIPQLINERALHWRMDREKLYLMLPKSNQLFLDFSTEEDREALVNMAYTIAPALIVVDSLSSISSKGENNVEDVRSVLGFLNLLAQDMRCGLLLIHHLRKRSQAQGSFGLVTIDSFRGSSHIIAMSRSVLGMSVVQTGPTPDRNGPRRLEIVKTNLAQYPPSLGVEFVAVDDGVELLYGDAPVEYAEPEQLTKSEMCAEWLAEMLAAAGEPMIPKEIVELAEAEGYSRSNVYRARTILGAAIVSTDGKQNPNSKWALAE